MTSINEKKEIAPEKSFTFLMFGLLLIVRDISEIGRK